MSQPVAKFPLRDYSGVVSEEATPMSGHHYRQLPLLPEANMTAIANWSEETDAEHGEVFTRRWVVDLILDMAGYTTEADLASMTVVEPSCGGGAFISAIVERLLISAKEQGHSFDALGGSVRAFDLLRHNVEISRKAAEAALLSAGCEPAQATSLASSWIHSADFLLEDHEERSADFVIGNPPYIRLEDVPTEVSDEYRRRWPTMKGRADIFIGFYEKGLGLLKPEGKLAFICADRWMRNQYGGALRSLIADRYAMDSVLVMHDVDAFEEQVSAYPAITVLRNGQQRAAKVVEANGLLDEASASSLAPWVTSPRRKAPSSPAFEAAKLPTWFDGPGLWPSGSPQNLELLADLERRFEPLENPATGTRVGIGVATGCDDVYLRDDQTDVEPERLLPIVKSGDITSGSIEWSGTSLVNPWNDEGLVDLAEYPKLADYLNQNKKRIRERHVAKKNPGNWFRTIDRVTPMLVDRPKLLLPDIKAAAHPVLDTGGYYPHHNLYYIVSDSWDLEVLGGLLLSDFANLFVGAYCVKMRGGTYRFQAQYLRTIRVPDPKKIKPVHALALVDAFRARDNRAANSTARKVYGL